YLESARVEAGEFGLAHEDRPTLAIWLRRPEARIEMLRTRIVAMLGDNPVCGVETTVETEVKYAGYIGQQVRQIERMKASESRSIPDGLDFGRIPGLSIEVQQKLDRVRPDTLGQ